MLTISCLTIPNLQIRKYFIVFNNVSKNKKNYSIISLINLNI
ncbi:hypothetical protein A1OE_343 [Candidatus Endolissoclinum faulkneri L2]|uniref:Uncharacterized protein n=1 Tax=Candidatus Endolissoclinum faulkneri L2 TaxID=1193729 RepID=K7Z3I3_9PROT|nr:hypothetical protein A1OE_343 [Candidatus Endolissoclinum faulkneri L2]